jgi:hypothetical protein
VGVDQRHQLRQEHLTNCDQIALALQHTGEPGEVRLEPVLLGVAVGCEPQIIDHRIDVVFQLGDLAAGLDLDGTGQVTLGDGRGDLGDSPYLPGQVVGQQVDIASEVLPRAGGPWDIGLAAQAAFHTHLACHGRNLVGEGGQRVRHIVDRFRQGRDFPLRVDPQFLREVAVSHGGHDFDDAAHLLGKVGRHEVDVVGQVLPHPAHPADLGLAAELAVRADLARHARHLGREHAKLLDHGVHDRGRTQELTFQRSSLNIQLYGLRQVALRHSRNGTRDVGRIRSSISVLTETSISPQEPFDKSKRVRSRVFPSFPTTCPTRLSS